MRRSSPYLLLLPLALLALSTESARGDELFPVPTLDESRQFAVLSPQKVIPIETPSPVSVKLVERARDACAIDPKKATSTFTEFLSPSSAVFFELNSLFDRAFDQTGELKLTIVIDDFGRLRTRFNSIYVPPMEGLDGPVILLDCAIAAQVYWKPSLAHELTHALLHAHELETWFEEGLAQLMEAELGGTQPEKEATLLEEATSVPSLIERRAPLPSGSSYAISYLFLKYLKSTFGGWPLLREMAELGKGQTECPDGSFFDQVTCRARFFMKGNPEVANFASKMTPAGIFRFFAVAMTLNDKGTPYYSIPGWKGFLKPFDPGSLPPFSFAKLDRSQIQSALDPRLESYWITAKDGRFRIAPLPTFSFLEFPQLVSEPGFVLVINLRSEPLPLLRESRTSEP